MEIFCHTTQLILFMFTMFGLSGCGFISDHPIMESEIFKSQEMQTCSFNLNQMSEIFRKDKKAEIRCMQENFNKFAKYVRTQNKSSVSEGELSTFIKRFFGKQAGDSVFNGLSLLFQFNMLLLRDEANHISRTKITPLFEFLVNVNQEALTIVTLFEEISKLEEHRKQIEIEKASDEIKKTENEQFFSLRSKLLSSVENFAKLTVKIIDSYNDGSDQKIDLLEFLQTALNKVNFQISNGKDVPTVKKVDLKLIDSLIFIKKLFVGGDRNYITSSELKLLISKLPQMTSLAFDGFYLNQNYFIGTEPYSRYNLYLIKRFQDLLFFDQTDFELFTIDQFVDVATDILQSDILNQKSDHTKNIDIKKFVPSIISLKKAFLKSNGKYISHSESFTFYDLKMAIHLIDDFLEQNYLNRVEYEHYKDTIEKAEGKIVLPPPFDLPELQTFLSASRLYELHNQFLFYLNTFKYYRSDKKNLAIYDEKIHREKFGLMEIGQNYWFATKLLQGYGHQNAQNEWQVNMEEIKSFLFSMKPILEEFNLWTTKPDNFARNTILIADLFQQLSNGDNELNILETTEYLQMLLSSILLSDKVSASLNSKCAFGEDPKKPQYDKTCFNENILPLAFHENLFGKNMPYLKAYIDSATKEDMSAFLSGIEAFARDSDKENVPIGNRDMILILGTILNIETTFMRFDLDKSNDLNFDEIQKASSVYEKAILLVAQGKITADNMHYIKTIFTYLVSKMELPKLDTTSDKFTFAAYHQCLQSNFCREKFIDHISAKRINVSKILYYLVKSSSPNNLKAPSAK